MPHSGSAPRRAPFDHPASDCSCCGPVNAVVMEFNPPRTACLYVAFTRSCPSAGLAILAQGKRWGGLGPNVASHTPDCPCQGLSPALHLHWGDFCTEKQTVPHGCHQCRTVMQPISQASLHHVKCCVIRARIDGTLPDCPLGIGVARLYALCTTCLCTPPKDCMSVIPLSMHPSEKGPASQGACLSEYDCPVLLSTLLRLPGQDLHNIILWSFCLVACFVLSSFVLCPFVQTTPMSMTRGLVSINCGMLDWGCKLFVSSSEISPFL